MIRPLGDRVVVKPLSKEEVTKSGIILPESAQQKPQEGTVLAVGPGKYMDGKLVTLQEMGIEVGQVVMFTKYGPTEITVEDEDLYMIESGDIMAVVDQKDKK